MKWKIVISVIALLAFCRVEAQISEGGLPPSFNYASSLRSTLPVVDVPVTFNVEDQILVDEWQVSAGSPLRVAHALPVHMTMDNSGQWSVLPDGERIWQLRIQAQGAIALMLYYKAFDIPVGAKLFIYNADKTQVLGAYTSNANPGKGSFATEFVGGDDLILEYVASSSESLPHLEINEIGYGYNHLAVLEGSNLRSSGSCMVSVNCSEGAAWQKEKAGVCRTIQKIGIGSYYCTGSLVNNTAEDFKPYILMAYHCMESLGAEFLQVSTPEEMKQWLFYFNHERLGCSSGSIASAKVMVGCTKKASSPIDGGSDGLLVLLNQEVPENYNVYYNGWDRRNTASQSGVGIHHPGGDYKKISTFTSPATQATWQGDDLSSGARNAHWNVIFKATENGYAVTEGGSSGSPLFNQNHLIVGTLSGGTSSCEKPGGVNLYGKFHYHWDGYSSSDTARMDVWLDPLKKGVETLSGLSRTAESSSPTGLKLTYTNGAVTLNWEAPIAAVAPTGYKIYRMNQLVGTSTRTTYTDDALAAWGEMVYGVSAEYADGSESALLSDYIYVEELKAPTNLTVEVGRDQVSLGWKAPLYTQTISWSTNTPWYALGVGPNIPIYSGHLWDTDDLVNLNNNLITAIEFYAVKDAEYSLLILQDTKKYEQAVVTPSSSGFISVALTTPFVINSAKELIISLRSVETKENVFPVVCDAGPAEIGKGNLISEDGEEWYVLYDGDRESYEEMGEQVHDVNFVMGAVISSEKGTVRTSVLQSSANALRAYSAPVKKATLSSGASLRSATSESTTYQYPVAFPEIKGYNVYRNGSLLNGQPRVEPNYTDKQPPAGNYTYGIATVYSSGESDKLLSSSTPVANEVISADDVSLSPSVFSDYVRIANVGQVKRIEVYALSGVQVLQQTAPDEIINTSGLVGGVYIFRLHTDDGIKTVRAIKK